MFSLQKLFGHDDKFFTLLEASAEECRASIRALRRIVTTGGGPVTLEEFVTSRRNSKKITMELNHLLCRVSVMALDREDVAGPGVDSDLDRAAELALGGAKAPPLTDERSVGVEVLDAD